MDRAGHRWFFDSGALSLDLGYTGPFDTGVEAWERLHSAADLAGWLTERFGTPFEVSAAEYDRARRLRAAIVHAAWAAVAGRAIPAEDVDLINTVAAGPDLAPRLPGGTETQPPVQSGSSTGHGRSGRGRGVLGRPRADPGLRRRRLRADLLRRVPTQFTPLVLDAPLRQPGQGPPPPPSCQN